jgi:hypothetical protein
VTALAQSRALHGVGERSSGISRIESDIVLHRNMLASALKTKYGGVKSPTWPRALEKKRGSRMRGCERISHSHWGMSNL